MTLLFYVLLSAALLLSLGLFFRERARARRLEKLLAEIEQLAHQLERARIARELHDSVGHDLTLLGTKLDLAFELLQKDPQRAAESIASARNVLTQCTKDMREALHVVRDPQFDFTQALVRLLTEFKAERGVDVKFTGAPPDLTPGTGRELFRVVQECLTNIKRHSDASLVEVEIAQRQTELEVKITDDGKGFKTSAATEGLGLKGINERIENLDGKVELESEPDGGTRVKLNIPL